MSDLVYKTYEKKTEKKQLNWNNATGIFIKQKNLITASYKENQYSF